MKEKLRLAVNRSILQGNNLLGLIQDLKEEIAPETRERLLASSGPGEQCLLQEQPSEEGGADGISSALLFGAPQGGGETIT